MLMCWAARYVLGANGEGDSSVAKHLGKCELSHGDLPYTPPSAPHAPGKLPKSIGLLATFFEDRGRLPA